MHGKITRLNNNLFKFGIRNFWYHDIIYIILHSGKVNLKNVLNQTFFDIVKSSH